MLFTICGIACSLLMNSVAIFRASAIFVGVYEPAKQQLLKSLPENLSALAHLVSLQPVELLCNWSFLLLLNEVLPSMWAAFRLQVLLEELLLP